MSRAARLCAVVLVALGIAVVVPGTAHAAGTYRNDDGTMEDAVHLDTTDGDDLVYTSPYMPLRHVNGATGATLWVYARASECDIDGLGHRLEMYPYAIEYDPCEIWSTDSYAWHGFDLPISWLRDGASNAVTFDDLDTRETTDQYLPRDTGRNAHYGVDTDTWGYSQTQRDAAGARYVTGRLMAYWELTGTTAKYFAGDGPARIFGTHDVGTTAPDRTITVQNVGLIPTTVTSITVTGAAAGDFAIVSDTCGTLPADSTTCTFGVRFTPQAPGSRYAAAVIEGTDAPPLSVTLHGEATAPPPVTTITTPDGSVLMYGDGVGGVVNGTSSLVRESLSFDPVVPGLASVTVYPELSCDAAGTTCTWHGDALLVPGLYTVTAFGTDYQRSETPGDSIQVTIV